MKVLKFGGTSVGNAQRMRSILEIINTDESQVVVLSAVAGTTNELIEINDALYHDQREVAHVKIDALKESYKQLIKELYTVDSILQKAENTIKHHFDAIYSLSNDLFTQVEEKIIVAQGELLSTALFHYLMEELDIHSVLLQALDFMKTDENNEPDIPYIKEHLVPLLAKYTDKNYLFITQGFICRNSFGEVDNLQRGGSDYSASLIGSVIQAEEVQIWTDIDGMHNNDPRIVANTKPIANLSFDEAAELAYFGAKILHPQSIHPAQKHNVPVRLLNTLSPTSKGTLISEAEDNSTFGVRAIAAKDNIIAIRIHSSRMLMAYGFLRRIFEVFERYKTPIDLITTSEVAVSLTIDNKLFLNEIVAELNDFGSVSVDYNQTIICVVGTFDLNSKGYAAQIFEGIKQLPIRMISYGGSNHNVSILIDTKDKMEALQSLNNHLF